MASSGGSFWEQAWAWVQTLDIRTWGTGIGGFLVAYLTAFGGLRKITSDARKSRIDGDLELRGRLSAEAQTALDRFAADNSALRARGEQLQVELDEAWDAAHGMEDWARQFARHDFNNALTEVDALYRILARVIAHPRDDAAWALAQAALDNRKPWPTPVVPSPEQCRSRKP